MQLHIDAFNGILSGNVHLLFFFTRLCRASLTCESGIFCDCILVRTSSSGDTMVTAHVRDSAPASIGVAVLRAGGDSH